MPAGQPITIGGKTGTGDHRYQTYGKGGQLIDSRVVNRTATFVFYLGDRYFGTLTAAGARRAGRPVRLHQFAHRADAENAAAAACSRICIRSRPHHRSPATEPAATAVPPPAAPAAREPVKEKPEGATSQAVPPATEPPIRGGFPEDLEPSVVVPVPLTPPARHPPPPWRQPPRGDAGVRAPGSG